MTVQRRKKVFVSYNRGQRDWVESALVPVLEADGGEALIDYRQFEGGRTVIGQMDATQDKADMNLLVITPGYLASKACKHEMTRAIQRDPDFTKGVTLPVVREACTLPRSLQGAKQPLYVDLKDDRNAAQWDLLMRACNANLGTPVPQWLHARDEICRFIRRNESVNLIVRGNSVQWRGLLEHIKRDHFPALGEVDLQSGATATRRGFVEELLRAAGMVSRVSMQAGEDLVHLAGAFQRRTKKATIVIRHFDMVQRRPDYDWNLYAALRDLLTESRRLVLLIQSRRPFAELLPPDNPLSGIGASSINLVELREA